MPCATIIGSGPNGLSAAITLARAGWTVEVREAADAVGGSARSARLTLPGFIHDVCSTVLAFGSASPLFRELPLAEHGLELVFPEVPFAHPLDDGTAAVCHRSMSATADGLGRDGGGYRDLFGVILRDWDRLVPHILGPPSLPAHPVALARFGWRAMRSARHLAERFFADPPARALFAGAAAHAIVPLERAATGAFGLTLTASAHAGGWPFARGGMQNFTDALDSLLRTLGGVITTGAPVESLDEFPRDRPIICDVGPRQLLRLAGDRLPPLYRRRLSRFRYGPGSFKLDWALAGPVPWRAPACRRAGTVHLGGTFDEIAAAEAAVWRGEHPERPFVLFVQPTVCDPTRAPDGRHTAWAYCHTPHGSTVDLTRRIESQVERFAPGFERLVLARSVLTPAGLEQLNPNLVGGDITGGAQILSQLFTRPILQANSYTTPLDHVYLCSASTPPGAGVHGMSGFHAAHVVLQRHGSRAGRGRVFPLRGHRRPPPSGES